VGNCGESCLDPKLHWLYKILEPGLEKDNNSNTPCADRGYDSYKYSPIHSAGPIHVKLDMYGKHKREESFLAEEDSQLEDSEVYHFESKNYKNEFMRHRGFEMWKDANDGSDLFNQDSQFKIVPALWGGFPNISFESVNYPGFFLRHYNYVTFIQEDDGGTFKQDASFKPHYQGSVKFESFNYPDFFLRHYGHRVGIHKHEDTELFELDTTWIIHKNI